MLPRLVSHWPRCYACAISSAAEVITPHEASLIAGQVFVPRMHAFKASRFHATLAFYDEIPARSHAPGAISRAKSFRGEQAPTLAPAAVPNVIGRRRDTPRHAARAFLGDDGRQPRRGALRAAEAGDHIAFDDIREKIHTRPLMRR